MDKAREFLHRHKHNYTPFPQEKDLELISNDQENRVRVAYSLFGTMKEACDFRDRLQKKYPEEFWDAWVRKIIE